MKKLVAVLFSTLFLCSCAKTIRPKSVTETAYPLEDAVLNGCYALGVSNEFTGCEAHIHVNGGVLWIMWQGNADLPLPEFVLNE